PATVTRPIPSVPKPYNLVGLTGRNTVVLSWSVSDTTQVRQYYIWRGVGTDPRVTLVDSSTTRSATETFLTNGITYRFAISVLDQTGFQGPRSDPLALTPANYSIFITAFDNNSVVTHSPEVELHLSAPPNTKKYAVSEDSLFGDETFLD